MSYCRWSSMDFKCDLYVYEHVGGFWQAHVATRRRKGSPPVSSIEVMNALREGMEKADGRGNYNWKSDEAREKHRRLNTAYQDWLDCGDDDDAWDILPEPSTGSDFVTVTPGEMAEKLKALRAEGFMIPDLAIEELEEEQAEEDSG